MEQRLQNLELFFLIWRIVGLQCCISFRWWCCYLVPKSCPTLLQTHGLQNFSVHGFSRQYWRGLPFPSPGVLPYPGIVPTSPTLAGRFLITEPPGKPVWGAFLILQIRKGRIHSRYPSTWEYLFSAKQGRIVCHMPSLIQLCAFIISLISTMCTYSVFVVIVLILDNPPPLS